MTCRCGGLRGRGKTKCLYSRLRRVPGAGSSRSTSSQTSNTDENKENFGEIKSSMNVIIGQNKGIEKLIENTTAALDQRIHVLEERNLAAGVVQPIVVFMARHGVNSPCNSADEILQLVVVTDEIAARTELVIIPYLIIYIRPAFLPSKAAPTNAPSAAVFCTASYARPNCTNCAFGIASARRWHWVKHQSAIVFWVLLLYHYYNFPLLNFTQIPHFSGCVEQPTVPDCR